MPVNVWAQVGAATGYLPMTALLGTAGQLLGMNAGATLAEWKAATFLANQLAVPVGAVATPSYTFTGDLNTGFYQDTADKIGVAAGGVRVFQFGATNNIYSNTVMNGKVFSEEKSADIVAAANIDLATATGNYVYVTNAAGAIIITRLGGVVIPSGTCFELKFVIAGGTVTLKNDPNFLSLFGGADTTVSSGDVLRFRKTNDADQFWELVSISRGSSLQVIAAAGQPVTYIGPSIEDRPAITAGGWLPWSLNQQWGGAPMPFHMVDSATGVEYKFDAFDTYIDNDQGTNMDVGSAAARVNQFQSINPAKNLSLQAIWVKANKTGNPVDNLILQLWSVVAGLPNALIATANTINGKQITSDGSPQWYRFSFAAVQALVGGTQYMWVVTRSGAVDPANFYQLVGKGSTKFPSNLQGFGTAVPAWTAANTLTKSFICEAQASDQIVQTIGQFTGRIIGSEGNPINRSVAFCKPLREFFPLFAPDGWSISIRGKTWTKDRTICDLVYGPHHDRINIRCAVGTGYVTVTTYESDNTVLTTTGVNDVSGAAFKDIMIIGRSLNDGADYIKIYTGVNNVWSKEVESVGLSLIFDPLMLKQGTAWIMGGFKLFAAADYTKLSDMTILPSADGWTYTTTTATVEGNVFAVAGGKLNQIKAGMAAGGDGYYAKAALGLVNANGWFCTYKLRIISNSLIKDEVGCSVRIQDGAKNISNQLQDFYNSLQSTSLAYPQIDLKSADSTFFITGKGSDALQFINGRLISDFTSFMVLASGANQIDFGDRSVTANENADVIWDYMGYYNTANVYPQFTSGELHEFSVFSGDKNTLGQAVYNTGVPISIKTYCGLGRNYVEKVNQEFAVFGITNGPSTASTTDITAPEMEQFVLGSKVSFSGSQRMSNINAAAYTAIESYADGRLVNNFGTSTGELLLQLSTANQEMPATNVTKTVLNYGLHKLERRYKTSGGSTGSLIEKSRNMIGDVSV